MNIFNESGRFVENKQPENGREENIIPAPCIHVYLSLHANLLLHACPSPSRKPLPFMQTSFFMHVPPPSRKPLPFMQASYAHVSRYMVLAFLHWLSSGLSNQEATKRPRLTHDQVQTSDNIQY